MTCALGLLESAAWSGRCRYVELKAFALLGERARTAERDDLAVFLASASLAHAWRADLLEDLLPVSDGLPDAAACTVSPGALVEEALTACVPGSVPGAPGVEAGLLDALLGALYPAMAAAYRERLAGCARFSDGPLGRTLTRLIVDLEAVSAAGAALPALPALPACAAPGSTPGATRSGGSRRLRVEELLVQAGGPFGPLPAALSATAGRPGRAS